jgi:hypothetical protein
MVGFAWIDLDKQGVCVYINQMHYFQSRNFYRWSICIAAMAIAWFSLGNALNTMVALASGKTIDIVVCSGAGVKKISVPAHDGDETVSTIKHCGNAPIYKLIAIPGTPVHLNFEAPRTVAVWQWTPRPQMALETVQDNKPPPGRAPPEVARA